MKVTSGASVFEAGGGLDIGGGFLGTGLGDGGWREGRGSGGRTDRWGSCC